MIISIAGAGLVLALDHPQTDAGRPELTARGDAIIGPRLAALAPQDAALADAADGLAAHGRAALLDLRSQKTDAVRSDIAAGDQSLTDLGTAVAALTTSRNGLLDGTSLDRVSGANRDRVGAIDAAIAASALIPAGWQQIGDNAVLPVSVLESLSGHDAAVIAATTSARAADYTTALAHLGDAAAALASARHLSDLASGKGRDVSTLTGLILRSSDYDTALTRLYTLLQQSGGVMTPDASAALADVERAQTALPPDTSPLVVIASDLGGNTMTQGLIAIEGARDPIDRAAGR